MTDKKKEVRNEIRKCTLCDFTADISEFPLDGSGHSQLCPEHYAMYKEQRIHKDENGKETGMIISFSKWLDDFKKKIADAEKKIPETSYVEKKVVAEQMTLQPPYKVEPTSKPTVSDEFIPEIIPEIFTEMVSECLYEMCDPDFLEPEWGEIPLEQHREKLVAEMKQMLFNFRYQGAYSLAMLAKSAARIAVMMDIVSKNGGRI